MIGGKIWLTNSFPSQGKSGNSEIGQGNLMASDVLIQRHWCIIKIPCFSVTLTNEVNDFVTPWFLSL